MSSAEIEETAAALIRLPTMQPFGFVALESGSTRVLSKRAATSATDVERTPPEESVPSGVIYTDVDDMPSLEELLRANEVAFAVLERPAPSAPQEVGTRAASLPATMREGRDERVLSPAQVVFAASIPFTVSAVGWTLFATAVAGGSVRANPYTALSLGLGGLVLLATLLLAIRQRN